MHMAVETTQGVGRKMTITLPAEQVEQAVAMKLQHIAKKVSVHGFRPGKVPMAIVKQHHSASARQEVLQQLMQRNFVQAIQKTDLRLASQPLFTQHQDSEGAPFTYQVIFEVFPQITLQPLNELVVEYPQITVTEEDITAVLHHLRYRHAEWHPVDRTAAVEDRVTIDFSGTLDGVAFEGGQETNFALVLGKSSVVDGFAEGIVGHRTGEHFTVEVTFPVHYPVEHLRNQRVQFAIVLKQVEACTLPEWSPELLQQFGSTDGTLADLKEVVRNKMVQESAVLLKKYLKRRVVDALLKCHKEIDLPNALVAKEIEVLYLQRQRAHNKLSQEKLSVRTGDKATFEPLARRRVTENLLLAAATQKLEVLVDESHIEAVLQEIAASDEKPQEVMRHYRNQPALWDNLRHIALEEATVNALFKKVQIQEKPYTFSEFVAHVASEKN